MSRVNRYRGRSGLPKPRGVTLVELMVGMLVGLLAVLVISQVLLVSEGQKRTTTGGADAQVNGALALYTIQRDIETAGYGFTSSPNIIGCPISARYNGATPTGFSATLAPVFITPEASRPAGSVGDSIRMLASSKTSYSVPTRVIPPGIVVNGTTVPVTASLGFAQGDMALVAADAVQPCWVFQVTSAPTSMAVPRADNAATWNTAGTPTQAYGDGSVLVNLGTLVDNTYEIFNGTDATGQVKRNLLRVSSFDAGNPSTRIVRDVQPDIVNLRAYYGRDTTATPDGIVDVYDTTTPTSNADWLRVLSVRLIVVSRSGQYETKQVTPANPTWDVGATPPTSGATTCGSSQCLTIDVGAGVAGDVEAKHYRYKVFETIVPLRNMLWSS
jgi:type IV pilus assembly protein PilW